MRHRLATLITMLCLAASPSLAQSSELTAPQIVQKSLQQDPFGWDDAETKEKAHRGQ